MKHIELFESMGGMGEYTDIGTKSQMMGMNKRPIIYCISGDNGSAVGIVLINDQRYLYDYLKKNRDRYDFEVFEVERDGSFVVLTGNGDWKFVDVGETYTPEEGDTQFTLIEAGKMLAGFSGAETFWSIGTLSEILPEL